MSASPEPTMNKRPCGTCVETANDPLFNTPLHVVHPERGTPLLYDVRGVAVCRTCRAVWYRAWGCNFARLLG